MKDYKLSEIIEICEKNYPERKCSSCPLLRFCDQIDPENYEGDFIPSHWGIQIDREMDRV